MKEVQNWAALMASEDAKLLAWNDSLVEIERIEQSELTAVDLVLDLLDDGRSFCSWH